MRPATIASLEVDGLKPARLLVVALLTFALIGSASVALAAGRVALVVEPIGSAGRSGAMTKGRLGTEVDSRRPVLQGRGPRLDDSPPGAQRPAPAPPDAAK